MSAEYGADQIQILEGLEAVRKRPGMYIGSTSSRGLHHLVYEIVDNAVDEALAGFCHNILVTINKGDSVTVVDDGRGIPVGINKSRSSGSRGRFYRAACGRKIRRRGIQSIRRTARCGCICCKRAFMAEVEICHDGKIYQQRYERGKVMEKLTVIGECDPEKTGTKVTFQPDPEIFEDTVYDF